MKNTSLTIALSLLLASCSGGGGGSGPVPNPLPGPPVPLRILQNGDHWSYSVTGSVSLPGSGVTFSGTMERWIDTASTGGKRIHNEVDLNAAGGATQTGAETFFDQDASGNLTFFGDKNELTGRIRGSVPAGYLRLVSPIQVGDRLDSGEITFDDGSRLSSSFEVSAEETITVPAGTFKTYRVDAVEIHTNPTNTLTLTQDGSYWIDPEVGVVQYKGVETKTRIGSATPLYTL